jgi:hypothetical protein
MLAAAGSLGQLTHLHLDRNFIGDEGARALAASPALGRLTHLHLQGCAIRGGGARALVASSALGGLVWLDLRDNLLSAAERAELGSIAAGGHAQVWV